MGFANHPQIAGEFQLFQMKLYNENFSMEYDHSINVYLNRDNPKILTQMNSITYMSSLNIVNILMSPFDTTFKRNIQFAFDFFIHDYAVLSNDKCIAVSRDGWLGVYYEDMERNILPSNSFQLQLDDGEYVDCMVADHSSDLICIAASRGNMATKLIFCETVGTGCEVFLI
jgi:hypothetical protein